MFNLNYNFIGSQKQNRDVEGFQPFPRTDEFANYLVLAIAGTVFERDYEPQFGVDVPWQDISGYIRGDYTNISGSLTGSGIISSSSEVNKFTNSGYPSSLYLTGSISALFPNGGTPKEGLNLTTGSLQSGSVIAGTTGRSSVGAVIEAWVALEDASAPSQSYKDLAYMATDVPPGGISTYWYSANWNGDVNPGAEIDLVSGSSRFVVDKETDVEQIFNPSISGSRNLEQLQWNHFAVSIEAPWDNGLDSEPCKVRQFINGEMVAYGELNSDIKQSLNPLQVLGHVGDDQLGNPWIDLPAYIQDLRIYNGTNKNYTGSFTPPSSMIVGSPWA